jgi:hypothetical protein
VKGIFYLKKFDGIYFEMMIKKNTPRKKNGKKRDYFGVFLVWHHEHL